MSQPTRTGHGVLGSLLGIVTLMAPGALAVLVGAFRAGLPLSWLQYPVWMSEIGARALVLAVGVALLVVGKGYFSFRRIGWLGYMAWALWSAFIVVTTFRSGSAGLEIAWFPLLVIAGIPYVWMRRRDFDVGSRSTVAGR